MKTANEMIQIGSWRWKDNAFGKTAYSLTHSTLPPKLAVLTGEESVDDFCAKRDEAGRGIQKFIPYEEIESILQDGDILVFTSPKDVGLQMMDKNERMNCLKQRGWHAEIAYKNTDGRFWHKAPWHIHLDPHPCSEMKTSSEYSGYILAIYRVNLGVDYLREAALKAEVRRWAEIFCDHKFPEKADQFGIHEYLDPADFSSPEDLRTIAAHLIRGEHDAIQKVTCVQWAYQVLCLALNVPLTPTVLKEMGVDDVYEQNWAAALGYADDSLVPLNQLPYVPYSPAETLQSFLNTYAEGVSLLDWLGRGAGLASLLGFDLDVLIGEETNKRAEILREYFAEVVEKKDLSIPLIIPDRPPYQHVMPIQPFCEVRNPSRPTNLKWSYVATAVSADKLIHA